MPSCLRYHLFGSVQSIVTHQKEKKMRHCSVYTFHEPRFEESSNQSYRGEAPTTHTTPLQATTTCWVFKKLPPTPPSGPCPVFPAASHGGVHSVRPLVRLSADGWSTHQETPCVCKKDHICLLLFYVLATSKVKSEREKNHNSQVSKQHMHMYWISVE